MKHYNISEKVILFIMSRTLKELARLTRYEIAEKFNINISYLSGKFKKDTKMSVLNFIDFEKVSRARYMLEDRTDLTVEDISNLIGISKSNQFRIKFKKFYFITPGSYRKALKKRQIGTTK